MYDVTNATIQNSSLRAFQWVVVALGFDDFEFF
jgi:hypothetical protein